LGAQKKWAEAPGNVLLQSRLTDRSLLEGQSVGMGASWRIALRNSNNNMMHSCMDDQLARPEEFPMLLADDLEALSTF
jgi:hypothetical protein